jgi:DNA-directed RNA polymerase specialized sigma24 family protein
MSDDVETEVDLGGRPRIDLDFTFSEDKRSQYAQLLNLCRIQCKATEVAAFFGVSEDTIDRRLKEAHHIGFADFYKQHRKEGLVSLRRAQFQKALDGNPTMLIWMGKQMLGQRDKTETDVRDVTREEAAADNAIDAMIDKLSPEAQEELYAALSDDGDTKAEPDAHAPTH